MDEIERIAPESGDLEDVAEPREPTALERAFFTPLHKPTSPWQVVGWWESRRFLYNSVVGGAGVITTAVVALFGGGAGPPPEAFIIIPIVYGVAANLGYTLGWVVDLTLRRWLGRHADWAGPALLRYGFVFSVGLTLLPIPLVLFSWLVRTIFAP